MNTITKITKLSTSTLSTVKVAVIVWTIVVISGGAVAYGYHWLSDHYNSSSKPKVSVIFSSASAVLDEKTGKASVDVTVTATALGGKVLAGIYRVWEVIGEATTTSEGCYYAYSDTIHGNAKWDDPKINTAPCVFLPPYDPNGHHIMVPNSAYNIINYHEDPYVENPKSYNGYPSWYDYHKPCGVVERNMLGTGTAQTSCTDKMHVVFNQAGTFDIKASARSCDIAYLSQANLDKGIYTFYCSGDNNYGESDPKPFIVSKNPKDDGITPPPTSTSDISPPPPPPPEETGSVKFILPVGPISIKKKFEISVSAASSVGVKQIALNIGSQSYFFDGCGSNKSCGHTFVIGGGLPEAGKYPVVAWASSINASLYQSAKQTLIIAGKPPDGTITLSNNSVFYGDSLKATVVAESVDQFIKNIDFEITPLSSGVPPIVDLSAQKLCEKNVKKCTKSWTIDISQLPDGASKPNPQYFSITAKIKDDVSQEVIIPPEQFIVWPKSDIKPIIEKLKLNGIEISQTIPLTVVQTTINKTTVVFVQAKGANPMSKIIFKKYDTASKLIDAQTISCSFDPDNICKPTWNKLEKTKGIFTYSVEALDDAGLYSPVSSVIVRVK